MYEKKTLTGSVDGGERKGDSSYSEAPATTLQLRYDELASRLLTLPQQEKNRMASLATVSIHSRLFIHDSGDIVDGSTNKRAIRPYQTDDGTKTEVRPNLKYPIRRIRYTIVVPCFEDLPSSSLAEHSKSFLISGCLLV